MTTTRTTQKIERVGVFIDGANVFLGMRDKNSRMNYLDFIHWLVDGRHCVYAAFFNSTVPDGDATSFINHLKSCGIKPFLKRAAKLVTGGYKQTGIDVYLTVKAMSHLDEYDTLILVSGDSDFMPLIFEAQAKGKKVEVVSWASCMHPFYRDNLKHKIIDDFSGLRAYSRNEDANAVPTPQPAN